MEGIDTNTQFAATIFFGTLRIAFHSFRAKNGTRVFVLMRLQMIREAGFAMEFTQTVVVSATEYLRGVFFRSRCAVGVGSVCVVRGRCGGGGCCRIVVMWMISECGRHGARRRGGHPRQLMFGSGRRRTIRLMKMVMVRRGRGRGIGEQGGVQRGGVRVMVGSGGEGERIVGRRHGWECGGLVVESGFLECGDGGVDGRKQPSPFCTSTSVCVCVCVCLRVCVC